MICRAFTNTNGSAAIINNPSHRDGRVYRQVARLPLGQWQEDPLVLHRLIDIIAWRFMPIIA
jgi:hypothetical protein